jgi:hypothetical protein
MARRFVMKNVSKIPHIDHLVACLATIEMLPLIIRFWADDLSRKSVQILAVIWAAQ